MNASKNIWKNQTSIDELIEKQGPFHLIIDNSRSTEALGFSSDELDQYIESLSILTNIYIQEIKANLKDIASETFQNKTVVKSLNELASAFIKKLSFSEPDQSLINDSKHSVDTPKIEYIITRIFEKIGIPAHMKGREYLKEAIITVLNDSSAIHNVTKELYPNIAKQFSTTPTRVERAIRHAIETAWNRGDFETQQIIFGYTLSSHKDKPTNIEFIATIAEKIRFEYNGFGIAI